MSREAEAGKSRTAAAKRKPRVDGAEARLRILDSAEALFAERGFFGASVRDITQHSQQRLASINYYFGSKEELFRDVLLRRWEVLHGDRLRLLEQVRASGSQRSRTEGVVHAYVAPVALRARESTGFRNYLSLIAQVGNSRLPALALVASDFNPGAEHYVAAFAAIYPRCSARRLHHAFQFMLATTLYGFSDNRRLESMTQGTFRSDAFEALAGDLIPFIASGVVGLCSAREAGK